MSSFHAGATLAAGLALSTGIAALNFLRPWGSRDARAVDSYLTRSSYHWRTRLECPADVSTSAKEIKTPADTLREPSIEDLDFADYSLNTDQIAALVGERGECVSTGRHMIDIRQASLSPMYTETAGSGRTAPTTRNEWRP